MKRRSPYTAVILAGGRGTRLRPVVPDRQKVLAEVRGRPFLTYVLDQLADAGMRTAVLCTGYRGEQVEGMLGDTYRGVRLRYSRETQPLGTAGAIRRALPMIPSDPAFILNGDSIYRADFHRFQAWHQATGAGAALLLVETPDTRRYGRVEIEEDGAVTRFVEKARAGGPGWVNAGIYLIGHRLLRTIPTGRMVSLEHEMFPAWIGHGLYGYCDTGAFLDIGTPQSYARADSALAAS